MVPETEIRFMKKYLMLFVATTAIAVAGPPLICQKVEIGTAKSLPWRNVNAWNGAVADYKLAGLADETLSILTPTAPLAVRMETLRRAAIYAAKNEAVAAQLSSRLLARVANAEAAGKADVNAWFDTGYYAEALRQIVFVYRYDMLSPAEREQWRVRGDANVLDGRPWIERAIRMGGKGMEAALAKIDEYRDTDLKRLVSVSR
jgi:hypothetical protein